jgi:hypothetical protein
MRTRRISWPTSEKESADCTTSTKWKIRKRTIPDKQQMSRCRRMGGQVRYLFLFEFVEKSGLGSLHLGVCHANDEALAQSPRCPGNGIERHRDVLRVQQAI